MESIRAENEKFFQPIKMLGAGLGHIDYEDFEPARISDKHFLDTHLGDPSKFADDIDRPLSLASELKTRKTSLSVILTNEERFARLGAVLNNTMGDCCNDILFFVESE